MGRNRHFSQVPRGQNERLPSRHLPAHYSAAGVAWVSAQCRCGFGLIGGYVGSVGRCDHCHSEARIEKQDGDRVTIEWRRRVLAHLKAWEHRDGSPYSQENCCVCYRPTAADAQRVHVARTNGGEWWAIAPDYDTSGPEWKQLGPRVELPIGDDCLKKHALGFALVGGGER